MNQRTRAAHLMADNSYATPIQVAVLIKQMINASGVAIAQAEGNEANTLELVWHDGPWRDTTTQRSRINLKLNENDGMELILQLACRIYTPTESRYPIQQTRFVEPEGDRESGAIRSFHCQTVFWQTPWKLGPICFLWHSQQDAGFSLEDKHQFQQARPLASRLLGQGPAPLNPLSERIADVSQRESNWGALSTMERKVLDLLQEGMTEADVARALHRSPHTIHVHVKGLYRKFLVHSRAELIKAAQSRLSCLG